MRLKNCFKGYDIKRITSDTQFHEKIILIIL